MNDRLLMCFSVETLYTSVSLVAFIRSVENRVIHSMSATEPATLDSAVRTEYPMMVVPSPKIDVTRGVQELLLVERSDIRVLSHVCPSVLVGDAVNVSVIRNAQNARAQGKKNGRSAGHQPWRLVPNTRILLMPTVCNNGRII